MQNEVPTALVTGGARRIGAEICRTLHAKGYNLAVHYNHSAKAAQQLVEDLNRQRANSAISICASLGGKTTAQALATQVISHFGGCDLLINNASSFYPTPLANVSDTQWDDLFDSNAKAPLFLAQAFTESLKMRNGSIINIADIHAFKPLPKHTLYCMAKAANVMLTQALALELAPQVRVNGIAPGAMLWPETELHSEQKQAILAKIPLQQLGSAKPIAAAVVFLTQPNNYMTGQILRVDGGKSLY